MNNQNSSDNNKKKRKRTETEYQERDLIEAIDKVKSGEMSIYRAHRTYNVPRTTIKNHVDGKSTSFRIGRPPLLSEHQEKLLLDLVIQLAEWGYPLEREEFKSTAKYFAKTTGVTHNGSVWTPKTINFILKVLI